MWSCTRYEPGSISMCQEREPGATGSTWPGIDAGTWRPPRWDAQSQSFPEVPPVRHRRLLAALLCVLVSGGVLPVPIAAQSGGEPQAVTLELAPVGDATVTGLAVLAP